MEYAIAQADTSAGLVRTVDEMMEEGWHPQGGVSCVHRDYLRFSSRPEFRYVQAMVKEVGDGK